MRKGWRLDSVDTERHIGVAAIFASIKKALLPKHETYVGFVNELLRMHITLTEEPRGEVERDAALRPKIHTPKKETVAVGVFPFPCLFCLFYSA